MRGHRHVAAVALCLPALAGGALAGTAGASTASFTRVYAPVNAQIVALGDKIGSAVTGADKKTDAQLASQFRGLARGTAAAAAATQSLRGAPAGLRPLQAKLASALRTAALDLDAIRVAAANHDATAATTATRRLIADSPAVKSARQALSARLHLS